VSSYSLLIKKKNNTSSNKIVLFSALKSPAEVFILNKDQSKIAENGLFTFNDDSYEYDLENEFLTSRGPLLKAVNLMVKIRTT